MTQAYRRMKIGENMNMVAHTIDSIQFTFVVIDDAPDVFIQIVSCVSFIVDSRFLVPKTI